MQNNVRKVIRELGLSQKEVAERIGITAIGLSQLLRQGTLKWQTLGKLAGALNVPVWKLCLSDDELAEIRSDARPEEQTGQAEAAVSGSSFLLVVNNSTVYHSATVSGMKRILDLLEELGDSGEK